MDFHLVCYSEKEILSVVSQMKNPALGLEVSDKQTVFGIVTSRKCFVSKSIEFIALLLYTYSLGIEAVKWLETRLGWSSQQSLFFMRYAPIVFSLVNKIGSFVIYSSSFLTSYNDLKSLKMKVHFNIDRILQVRQIIHQCGDRDAKFECDTSYWRFQVGLYILL
jgi:hypothetical protein